MRIRIAFVIAFFITFAALATMPSFAENIDTNSFPDVAGTEYDGAVTSLSARGLINGYPDGNFKPEQLVSRAEICKMLVYAIGPSEEELSAARPSGFTDLVVYGWAKPYIDFAASKNIVRGYSDGKFGPERQITYDELSAILVRAAGFKDSSLLGTWPENYVNKANELGAFEGTIGFKSPADSKKAATRGDAAIMTNNMLAVIIAEDGSNSDDENESPGNVNYDDGYAGKLEGFSGRAYGIITDVATVVNSKGATTKQITFLFGRDFLRLNTDKESVEVPDENEYLSGNVYCLKMSTGIVRQVSSVGEEASPETFVELTSDSAISMTQGFAKVISRTNTIVQTEGYPVPSQYVEFNIVDTASLYVCEFDTNEIYDYSAASLRDIESGSYVKAYTVIDEDAGMANVVVIINKDDASKLQVR